MLPTVFDVELLDSNREVSIPCVLFRDRREERGAMGRRARLYAEQHCSRAAMGEKFVRTLEGVAADWKSTGRSHG